MDAKQFGSALQGMGAWWAGKGPQYENAKSLARQVKNDEDEANRRAEAEQRRAQRAQALNLAQGVKQMYAQHGAAGAMAVLNRAARESDPFLAPAINGYAQLLQSADEGAFLRELDGDIVGLGESIQQQGAEWKPHIDGGNVTWTNSSTREAVSRPVTGAPTPESEPEFSPKDQRDYLTKVRGVIDRARKEFEPVEVNYRNIKGATKNPSSMGDLGIVIGYMKMLDPQSVVREGEQAMVQNSSGLLAAPARLVEKLNSGKTLTQEQREGVLQEAQRLYQARSITRDAAIFDQITYAGGEGFPVDKVVGKYAGERWSRKTYTATNKQTGEAQQFSLSDLYLTARKHGKSVSQVVQDLGLDGGLYQ